MFKPFQIALVWLFAWLMSHVSPKLNEERGDATAKGVGMIFGGMILIVVGVILANIVIDTSAVTGGNANIGSFTGVQSVVDLAPLVFSTAVVGTGVALIGLALKGFKG